MSPSLNGYTPEEQAMSDALNAKLVHLNAQVNEAIADVKSAHANQFLSDHPTLSEIATVLEEVLPALEVVAQSARAIAPTTAVPIAAALIPVIHAAETLLEWVKAYRGAFVPETSEL